MIGIKKLPKKDISSYKPSDLWASREHAIFLKYCPSIRDRCYHAMAVDMSARPSEILNLKIKDIVFKITDDGKQYAEVVIKGGKTKPRTIPLIDSIPYQLEMLECCKIIINWELKRRTKTTTTIKEDAFEFHTI
jgi:integrase